MSRLYLDTLKQAVTRQVRSRQSHLSAAQQDKIIDRLVSEMSAPYEPPKELPEDPAAVG